MCGDTTEVTKTAAAKSVARKAGPLTMPRRCTADQCHTVDTILATRYKKTGEEFLVIRNGEGAWETFEDLFGANVPADKEHAHNFIREQMRLKQRLKDMDAAELKEVLQFYKDKAGVAIAIQSDDASHTSGRVTLSHIDVRTGAQTVAHSVKYSVNNEKISIDEDSLVPALITTNDFYLIKAELANFYSGYPIVEGKRGQRCTLQNCIIQVVTSTDMNSAPADVETASRCSKGLCSLPQSSKSGTPALLNESNVHPLLLQHTSHPSNSTPRTEAETEYMQNKEKNRAELRKLQDKISRLDGEMRKLSERKINRGTESTDKLRALHRQKDEVTRKIGDMNNDLSRTHGNGSASAELEEKNLKLFEEISQYEKDNEEDARIVQQERSHQKAVNEIEQRLKTLDDDRIRTERKIAAIDERMRQINANETKLKKYKEDHGSEMNPEKNVELARVLQNREEAKSSDRLGGNWYYMQDGPSWLYEKYIHSKER